MSQWHYSHSRSRGRGLYCIYYIYTYLYMFDFPNLWNNTHSKPPSMTCLTCLPLLPRPRRGSSRPDPLPHLLTLRIQKCSQTWICCPGSREKEWTAFDRRLDTGVSRPWLTRVDIQLYSKVRGFNKFGKTKTITFSKPGNSPIHWHPPLYLHLPWRCPRHFAEESCGVARSTCMAWWMKNLKSLVHPALSLWTRSCLPVFLLPQADPGSSGDVDEGSGWDGISGGFSGIPRGHTRCSSGRAAVDLDAFSVEDGRGRSSRSKENTYTYIYI